MFRISPFWEFEIGRCVVLSALFLPLALHYLLGWDWAIVLVLPLALLGRAIQDHADRRAEP